MSRQRTPLWAPTGLAVGLARRRPRYAGFTGDSPLAITSSGDGPWGPRSRMLGAREPRLVTTTAGGWRNIPECGTRVTETRYPGCIGSAPAPVDAARANPSSARRIADDACLGVSRGPARGPQPRAPGPPRRALEHSSTGRARTARGGRRRVVPARRP